MDTEIMYNFIWISTQIYNLYSALLLVKRQVTVIVLYRHRDHNVSYIFYMSIHDPSIHIVSYLIRHAEQTITNI